MSEGPERQPPARSRAGRWLPLAAILCGSATVFALGLHRHISVATLIRHHGAIHAFILTHTVAATALYAAIYIGVVTLALPGALLMTLTGGILFGGAVGGALAVTSAAIGATLVFLIAKSACGGVLIRRAGPLASRLMADFRADAFHYLLFLRLVPAFPFFLVNLVPALTGVRLGTFVAATVIGIIPAGFAFAYIGAGLDSAIRAQGESHQACLATGRSDCHLDFDIRTAVTPELLVALAALGVIALLPVAVKRWRARRLARSISA